MLGEPHWLQYFIVGLGIKGDVLLYYIMSML